MDSRIEVIRKRCEVSANSIGYFFEDEINRYCTVHEIEIISDGDFEYQFVQGSSLMVRGWPKYSELKKFACRWAPNHGGRHLQIRNGKGAPVILSVTLIMNVTDGGVAR